MTIAPEPAAGDPAVVDREAARRLGLALKGLLGAVRRMRGRETRHLGGLSDAQYQLLLGLREQDEVSAGELATLADLSPATTTQMLDGLETASLVRRERSRKDRRVVLTSLTERGHALLEERHATFAPAWRAATAEFTDEELDIASAVLKRLHTLFDETTPGGA